MINGCFWGQLWKTETFGWRFGSNRGMFEEQYMVDYFAGVAEAFTDEGYATGTPIA